MPWAPPATYGARIRNQDESRINRGKARVTMGTFQVPSALAPTCVARMRSKGGASIDRDKDGIANYCKAGIMARCHGQWNAKIEKTTAQVT